MKDDGQWKRQDQFAMAVFAAIIFILVLAGTWDLATLQANSSKSAGEQARNYAAESEQQIADTCIDPAPAALAKCSAEIVKASYENQRAEHDLVAQQAMGRWALLMLYITGGGVLVTGFGIYYVRGNLAEMQVQRSLMQRSVDISADADRPFMLVDTLKISGIESPPNGDGKVQMLLEYVFQNYGQGPAFWKTHILQVNFDTELPPSPTYGAPNSLRHVIGTKHLYKTSKPLTLETDAENVRRVLMGDYRVFVCGLMKYNGLHKREYHYGYAFEMDFAGGNASVRQIPTGPDSYWRTE